MRKDKILIIEDNESTRELVKEVLNNEGFQCRTAKDGIEGLKIFNLENHFSAVLVDIKMPGISGLEVLEEIKRKSPNTSVVILSGITDIDTAIDSMRRGADGYITKPFKLKELISTVKKAIEKRNLIIQKRKHEEELKKLVIERTAQLKETIKELNEVYRVTIESFIKALDFREAESEAHSKRTCAYTRVLAQEIGIRNKNELEDLEKGALLHDIGKIGIPDRILKKPSSLSPEEWEWIRKHPILGYKIIKNISSLKNSTQIVLFHHERYDGRGYPFGLSKEEIPIEARIFSVVDAFEAITTNRPYRKARSFEEAKEEIKRLAGAQFDPEIVKAFLSIPISKLKEEKNKIERNLKGD
ncbi:response regulator [SCandidatus Aminicenantes bacterium Aminicenantia_JdfR_composite]|nr:response regulator [SCandidatus Aminicenantes bacterium Aminicenantia_JdfR_composite]MCP2597694.1 response regulator [Candidatus Aminicenantes bacterium AC-335-G13]MCP2620629.1 response regulator [Candidatus Aminicenantes bacterium AC-334-E05]